MNQQERVSPGTAAPAEGSSCSHLSPWVFLVSALAVKTALMTVGLGGCQGPFTSAGRKGTGPEVAWCQVEKENPSLFASRRLPCTQTACSAAPFPRCLLAGEPRPLHS
uniref:Uncharacterized protein n=1 Tax=Anas platyrhynchos TaxID=8839 RepID=A0A8B9R0M3_ANAPL